MSTSLAFIGKQVTIYGGITVLIAGVIGGLFDIIVFLSLRTFRQSSCAFYLTIMSIVNVGQLLTVVLSQTMLNLYGSDGTDTSLFYCKCRFYLSVVCILTSLTCFCLATIDQYCATCSRPRLQQLCNIKLARRLVAIFILIWLLHGIPFLVLYKHVPSSITGKVICTITNTVYIQYGIYVVVLILFGFLPWLIAVIFGSMAYHNTQQLAYYTTPLVRRELDKQLTVMVLVQVLVNSFTLLPYTIVYTLMLNKNINNNPIVQARVQLSSDITLILYFLYFAVSINGSN